jgi:hypothetical protein
MYVWSKDRCYFIRPTLSIFLRDKVDFMSDTTYPQEKRIALRKGAARRAPTQHARGFDRACRQAVGIRGLLTCLMMLLLSVAAVAQGFQPDPPPPSGPVDFECGGNGIYTFAVSQGEEFGGSEICSASPPSCIYSYSYLGSALYTDNDGFAGTYIPNAVSSGASPSQFQVTGSNQQTVNMSYTLTTQPLPPSPNSHYHLKAFGTLQISSCGSSNGNFLTYFNESLTTSGDLVEASPAPTSYYVETATPPLAQTSSPDPVGEPIDPSAGNVYAAETDVKFASAGAIQFRRFYSSTDTTGADGVPGWRHSYDRYISTVYQTASSP